MSYCPYCTPPMMIPMGSRGEICGACSSKHRAERDKNDRITALESRLTRVETENAILKRALGLKVCWAESHRTHYVKISGSGETNISDAEREILEKEV